MKGKSNLEYGGGGAGPGDVLEQEGAAPLSSPPPSPPPLPLPPNPTEYDDVHVRKGVLNYLAVGGETGGGGGGTGGSSSGAIPISAAGGAGEADVAPTRTAMTGSSPSPDPNAADMAGSGSESGLGSSGVPGRISDPTRQVSRSPLSKSRSFSSSIRRGFGRVYNLIYSNNGRTSEHSTAGAGAGAHSSPAGRASPTTETA
jgi:hypothetical protein